eukprot:79216-Rhodomonas_salina.1
MELVRNLTLESIDVADGFFTAEIPEESVVYMVPPPSVSPEESVMYMIPPPPLSQPPCVDSD